MAQELGKVTKEIAEKAVESLVKAAEAFDDLDEELAKQAPSADTVVALGGKMMMEGVRFWARLVATPGKVADALSDDA